MNAKERLEAVVALERPDQVPVAPLVDHFAAAYTGVSGSLFMRNGDVRIQSILATMKELGPWDMVFAGETANAPLLQLGIPQRLYLPGEDLPENQVHQFRDDPALPALTREDYDLLHRLGFPLFMQSVIGRIYPEQKGLKLVRNLLSCIYGLRQHRKQIEAEGAEMAAGFMMPGPLFEYFSIGRGLDGFLDVRLCPGKIQAVEQEWAKAFTHLAIGSAKYVGVPRVFIGLSRSSMISPADFEKLVLPGLEFMVNTFVDAGITPLLHCDSNWARHLHFFQRFPRRKCILALDGHTDIFAAKEAVGGYMAIMGDVPAALLAYGAQSDVALYAKKLVHEMGGNGGFILSSGCSVPRNAKPENVRTLADTV